MPIIIFADAHASIRNVQEVMILERGASGTRKGRGARLNSDQIAALAKSAHR